MTATGATIVVADDDPTLLSTLTWILKDKGFEVVPVNGGEALVARLEEVEPDLLILDIMMPKVDGLQLLEQIKADERWTDLPVLMISSMPPEEATVRSLGLGAADFVPKPFRVKELLARIEAQLRAGWVLREARREARQRASQALIQTEMVDILHEVTDALGPEDIYHILARRVARVLRIAKCSIVIAKPGDTMGTVVVAAEAPMLRNLEIRLDRYPEVHEALATNTPVLVSDVHTDPLYGDVREQWLRDGIKVPTQSVIAVPFSLRDEQSGVFFLRTTADQPPLSQADLEFADNVVKTAVSAIKKAYALQTAESDKKRFEVLATTDQLTGCLNRHALKERLGAEMDRMRRYGLALGLLMIDLDRFKQVNDSRGHLVGDRVLTQVGDLLRREVRSVDVVARYGGEEFVIALPETGLEGALSFAERIRVRIEGWNFGEADNPLYTTVSVGAASVPGGNASDPESLIAIADEALYRAKNGGRNLVSS